MKKTNLILLGLVILTGLVGVASANMMGDGYGGGMMYGGYGGTWMIFGWIFYLLIITLIIAAIYWLIKSANSRDRRR